MIRVLIFVGFVCVVVTVTRMQIDGITLLGALAWFLACLPTLIHSAARRHTPEGPTS